MAEGHRMRLMSIRFDTPKAAALPAADTGAPGESSSRHTHRPVPVVTYPLLGAGVAGLAVFGAFAGLGKSKQNGLEHNCAPTCTDSQLKPMKTDYLIGDVGLGVGVAALVATAVVYFARPEVEDRPAPAVSVEVGPAGADVRRNQVWGASATLRW